ncbi:XdhC family protein [Chryseolinea lacunae]|uniref:XdhC family protein n=1 Tax=Chryseolinea lacunae TaxID=2801331 RepID=A0ABS1KSF6_9BACT|nr:XdhC/CoxI family protein [Chryseolinea lacunae]MBL0742394.1 XdhC family protein [Chryseolinea lacunae]
MKEFRAILDACKNVDFTQRKAALATVVKVRGSSYRSPGARMLITDDGKWVGSISGGCLEGDALRKARQVMTTKIPLTVTYDTSEESNQNLGIGLGCNGVIDVLIEAVDLTDEKNPIGFFENIIALQVPVTLATVFAADEPEWIGRKLLMTESGDKPYNFLDVALDELITPHLQELFESKKSEARIFTVNGKAVDVFTELIQPSTSLLIFGGGFDARPVTQLAKALGWEVTVTDECVAHIAPLFFPNADKLSLCHRDFIDRDFIITPYTACVLMSHNYTYDRDVLKKLLRTPTPYIGILGPRKRFDKMLAEFEQSNITVASDDFHRIHSPIGLDIGAEAPDEIAVSIIAEIQSKFTNRSGGFLKYRQGPIHHRDAASDQVFKQVYLHTEDSKKSATRP